MPGSVQDASAGREPFQANRPGLVTEGCRAHLLGRARVLRWRSLLGRPSGSRQPLSWPAWAQPWGQQTWWRQPSSAAASCLPLQQVQATHVSMSKYKHGIFPLAYGKGLLTDPHICRNATLSNRRGTAWRCKLAHMFISATGLPRVFLLAFLPALLGDAGGAEEAERCAVGLAPAGDAGAVGVGPAVEGADARVALSAEGVGVEVAPEAGPHKARQREHEHAWRLHPGLWRGFQMDSRDCNLVKHARQRLASLPTSCVTSPYCRGAWPTNQGLCRGCGRRSGSQALRGWARASWRRRRSGRRPGGCDCGSRRKGRAVSRGRGR